VETCAFSNITFLRLAASDSSGYTIVNFSITTICPVVNIHSLVNIHSKYSLENLVVNIHSRVKRNVECLPSMHEALGWIPITVEGKSNILGKHS
jgi:hypothetical protein